MRLQCPVQFISKARHLRSVESGRSGGTKEQNHDFIESGLSETDDVIGPQTLFRDFSNLRAQRFETSLSRMISMTPLDFGQHRRADENQTHGTG